MDFLKTGSAAITEIGDSIARIEQKEAREMVGAIADANRIALYGVGREGLMIKAFAMRLYHLGLHAHVVGDMTTPPVGEGDLLIVSAGPGAFSTVSALVDVAQNAGATTACFTAQPGGAVPKRCDHVMVLPAQTMADDRGNTLSTLPMGSLYEGVQFVAYEILILMLADHPEIGSGNMRARHTNLE